MARYTLTKNFSEIAETYGVAQSGIILRPFHSIANEKQTTANDDSDVTFDEYGNLFLRDKIRHPPLKNAQKKFALRVYFF